MCSIRQQEHLNEISGPDVRHCLSYSRNIIHLGTCLWANLRKGSLWSLLIIKQKLVNICYCTNCYIQSFFHQNALFKFLSADRMCRVNVRPGATSMLVHFALKCITLLSLHLASILHWRFRPIEEISGLTLSHCYRSSEGQVRIFSLSHAYEILTCTQMIY